jgi:4-amino-4-deoxy-L-arabinose transferase-like glycosyltransferase
MFLTQKRLLYSLLFLKALLLCILIVFGNVALSPDEAQYWTWSRSLDWGYYSKPPGIAWQIWATTHLFGSTELGVRFGALLIGFFQGLAIYSLARRSGQTREISFWAALIFALCPLGIYLSFAAITEVAAILFITLATGAIARGLQADKRPSYYEAGAWILCGSLFKWVALLFWPLLLFFALFNKRVRSWHLLGALLLSLIALLPSIYWNATHEWATFKHVGATISKAKGGNFLDFFSAQIGLTSLLLILLILGIPSLFKAPRQPALLFCALFPLAVTFYLIASLFKKIQPNWPNYLYPPGAVVAAYYGYLKTGGRRLWLTLATLLSVVIATFALLIPSLQENQLLKIPYQFNPLQQAMGWRRITPILKQHGYDPSSQFLFADKYQAASLLSFYGPEQKRAYFFNLGGARKNQFSYWPQMEEKEQGKSGYFLLFENMTQEKISWYEAHYLKALAPYFAKVEWLGTSPLFETYGTPVKYALLFKCIDYNGKSPSQLEKY